MGRFKKPESGDEKDNRQNKPTLDFPEQMIPLGEINKNQKVDQPVIQPDVTFETLVIPPITTEPKAVVLPDVTAEPQSVIQPGITGAPKSAGGKPQFKTYIPKPIMVDTKLTIILVENTEEVVKQKDKLEKLVKSIVTTGQILVINYGRVVREGKVIEAKKFKRSDLVYDEFAGKDACLYDAIIALEGLVEKHYKKTADNKLKRTITRINSIEIIGIGRCVDNCSISSSQIAETSFCRITKYIDVTTKYFCLTEESFVNAATIGFHSIGAINRNYM